MKFYDVTLFCDKESKLQAHVHHDKAQFWPTSLIINSSDERHTRPAVTFHFANMQQLLDLSNSLLQATADLETVPVNTPSIGV